MQENTCRFVPFHNDMHSIHTINFVLETKPQQYNRLKIESVYKMYLVCSGQGYIHVAGKINPLKAGDVFFTFPASAFAIESAENFSYMYISFVGSRGNMILENLKISNANFIFHNLDEVSDFWEKGLSASPNVIDLMSESVLLYTFSILGNKLLTQNSNPAQSNSVDRIKNYIDEHFSEQNFSLEKMGKELSYNKKYISSLFKKSMGIGIIDYLNTIRIQNACTMMEQGFVSVSDIAYRCGYSCSQYFSKKFKAQIGITPTEYIEKLQNNKN